MSRQKNPLGSTLHLGESTEYLSTTQTRRTFILSSDVSRTSCIHTEKESSSPRLRASQPPSTMVQLEEVEDAELDAPQPTPYDEEDDADFTDTGKPALISPRQSRIANPLTQSPHSPTTRKRPTTPPLTKAFPTASSLCVTWSPRPPADASVPPSVP